MADESKFMVYRRVLVGENTMETIQKCLVTWGDKLQADLISRDESTMNFAKKALEIEEMMVRFSEIFLPNRFKGKNYSRLNAVYAFPFEFPENWCYPNFIPHFNFFFVRLSIQSKLKSEIGNLEMLF